MRKLYTIYVATVFLVSFFLSYPFYLIGIIHPSLHWVAHFGYKFWGRLTIHGSFIPFKVDRRYENKLEEPVVFCPNHTSYLDIPAMYLTAKKGPIFMGKASLGKVPLFGLIYRKVHILVDRKSIESKQMSLIRSEQAIDKGYSVCIFPEGTIPNTNNPSLINFKDGAFRLAIQKQIPIIPVTFPYNWIILPDDFKNVRVNYKECRVIVHEPISTKGMTLDDTKALKLKVKGIIEAEIKKWNEDR